MCGMSRLSRRARTEAMTPALSRSATAPAGGAAAAAAGSSTASARAARGTTEDLLTGTPFCRTGFKSTRASLLECRFDPLPRLLAPAGLLVAVELRDLVPQRRHRLPLLV